MQNPCDWRLGCASQEVLNDFSITAPRGNPLSVAKDQHLITLVEWLGGADVGRVDDD
jgi:hypothetical protein